MPEGFPFTHMFGRVLCEHMHIFRFFFFFLSAERFSVHVKDVVTGKDLPDVVDWCKFGGITWEEGARGFFYSAFPRPKSLAVRSGKIGGALNVPLALVMR